MKIKNGFKSERIIVIPINLFNDLLSNPYTKNCYITDIGFFPEAKHHYYERKDGALTYILLYCVKGKGEITLGDRSIQLSENQIFIIPKSTPHHYKSDSQEPWSIFWLHFEYTEFSALFSGTDIDKVIKVELEYGTILMKIFNNCFNKLDSIINIDVLTYCSCLLHELLGIVFLCSKQGTLVKTIQNNDYVEIAIDFMNKNINNSISLNEICDAVALSRSRLITLFKQSTGHSPIDYFILMKLQKCCIELDYSSKTVKEIGHLYGFTDQFYFSRTFKKHIGLSPNKYRYR